MATDAQRAMLARIAPQFSGRADRDEFIDDALLELSRDTYGTRYDRAVVLHAAHHLELRRRVESGMAGVGAVIGQSAGAVSYGAVSGATGAAGDAALRTTTYGLQLADLSARMSIRGPSILDGRGGWD